MASDDESVPSPAEVQKQLSRVVESRTFRDSTSQVKVLQFIVRNALEGIEITNKDINTVLFPNGHYDPESTVGRATASNLRTTLTGYYEVEGKDDPVIIRLPRGKTYKPELDYNPRSPACRAYRQGMAHLHAFLSDENGRLALQYLTEAIRLDPLYATAHAAKAQVEFVLAIYRHDAPPTKWIALAEASALEALRHNSASWRAHVVLGAVYCSRFKWDEAKKAFQKASEADAFETDKHFFYMAYLMAIGEAGEAVKLARSNMLRSPEDAFAILAVAAMCYLSRGQDFLAAYDLACSITREYRGLAFAHALQSCAAIGLGRDAGGLLITTAIDHVEDCHRLLGLEAFPGLAILALGAQMMVVSDYDRRRNAKAVIHDRIAQLEIQARKGYLSHFQLALAYIGAEEWEDALEHLAHAASENDPKMIWLNLWPLFDPIRERDEYKNLVRAMGLPKPETNEAS